ncbi:DUF3991 domain-containing protein [Agrobacterium tumefaciens]|uniref:DUF3991 and toprim domain-containing protein n=1 Tax=Agrobacterium tumefaciens TaxID=358 RepID=UPI00157331DC|nr:DUF3991 and toprim domain-containing protein [Agrobacterium tumefaciens]NSZ02081.1 DUF3991 domain-containing protein [Agrobacterium tumefaciens]NTB05708.1 DUF3991 domain-containing protein [Agrobacterium tumefaciens]NTB21807.1 DUF3991 domain-containing protein [Agrobacterium tumefaciens]NTB29553.1 DUF3991 domain-containing protein [Agrobacterium tumefaciens]NTB34533.1 DUF3991 domain-containing protein [Agrobacterium tumefaciens]
MKREEIEKLREAVSCAAVLEQAGFAVDMKESTRRAVKYRRGAEIIIVTHDGRGWFDPLSDDKGDVFALACQLEYLGFSEAVGRVGDLIGYNATPVLWKKPPSKVKPVDILARWQVRRPPATGSGAWRYLCWSRAVPISILRSAIAQGIVREGPFGSMWAAHIDSAGRVVGWEERGPDWRGFSTGGSKVLFRLGAQDAVRLCVTEAAIDAMSLAAVEDLRDDSLYLSTGGGWSPKTEAALVALLARPGAELVCATDANDQGDAFARRLQALAVEVNRPALRLRPPADDWNEVLQVRKKGEMKTGEEGRRAASPSTASREAAPG